LRSFKYLEPESVEELVRILTVYGKEAKVLAGGVDLVRRMRRGEIKSQCVAGLQMIHGLDYIEGDGREGLRIGALTTLRTIELSPIVQKDYVLLYEAIHQIASIAVKNMGTAVGNLCVASPASDVAPPLLALGAELKITGPTSKSTMTIESFFIGVNRTALQPSEIVTGILVPSLPDATGGAFVKLARTASDIAKVNVAVTLTVTNNTCKDARIALGSVAPTVVRARKAENIVKGQKLEPKMIAEAAEAATEEAKTITDVRSTAEYRKRMARVLVKRAIEKAAERAAAKARQ